MISYTINCNMGHSFDVWFPSYDSCKKQLCEQLIECPYCGSIDVYKGLSRSEVSTKSNKSSKVHLTMEKAEILDKVKRYILKMEDVGEDFARMALAMQRGEIPHKKIRGSATLEEIEELQEESIDCIILPDFEHSN